MKNVLVLGMNQQQQSQGGSGTGQESPQGGGSGTGQQQGGQTQQPQQNPSSYPESPFQQ